jgi:hypothetical protein
VGQEQQDELTGAQSLAGKRERENEVELAEQDKEELEPNRTKKVHL